MPRKITKDTSFNKEVGKLLRNARVERKMTLDELSEAANLGLTKSALSYIELGAQQLTTSQLFKICRTLNLSADSLFKKAETAMLKMQEQNIVILNKKNSISLDQI